jgi:hypothetical protein
MRDARYLRAQAELCLEMARQVSDRATSDNLRAEAARYHAEAAEIETGVKTWELKEPPSRIDSSIEAGRCPPRGISVCRPYDRVPISGGPQ